MGKKRQRIQNKIRRDAQAIFEVLEYHRGRAWEHIHYMEDEFIPALHKLRQNNVDAFNLNMKNNQLNYLSDYEEIVDRVNANSFLDQLQGAIQNNSDVTEDVVYTAMSKSTKALGRCLDKVDMNYKVNKMNLEHRMAEVENTYKLKLHEAEENIKDTRHKIDEITREYWRVERERDDAIARVDSAFSGWGRVGGLIAGIGLGMITGGLGFAAAGFSFSLGALVGGSIAWARDVITHELTGSAVQPIADAFSSLVAQTGDLGNLMSNIWSGNAEQMLGTFDVAPKKASGKDGKDNKNDGFGRIKDLINNPQMNHQMLRDLGGRISNVLGLEKADYDIIPASKVGVINRIK